MSNTQGVISSISLSARVRPAAHVLGIRGGGWNAIVNERGSVRLNDGSSDAGKSLTKSASNVAPHLAAHPPHDVHSVRRNGEMLGKLLMAQSLEAASRRLLQQKSKSDHTCLRSA